MRGLVIAGSAMLVAACSLGALDGFSGTDVPDGGPVSTDGGTDTNAADAPPMTGAYHLAVAADAPLAHFALEETSGAACASRTSTSAVCVYPPDGITRGQAGVGGTKALRFEATTAKLVISGLPGDLSTPYTFELWLRLDTAAAGTALGSFMSPSTGNGDGFNLFLWDNARLRTELWKANVLIAYGAAPSALAPATWHHVVITHSPSPHVDLFYVDAQLVENATVDPSVRPLVTGAFQLSGFVGFVDEIAVYDKTLAAGRIAAHYAAQ